MLLLAVSLASAAPIFLEATDGVQLDVSGNWPRAFPRDDGWWVTNAAGGEYNVQVLSDDLTVDRSTRRALTDVGYLLDHVINQCPDGSYLHFATASLVGQNDSTYAFRYDADFNLVASAPIVEGDIESVYVDIPGICSENFEGFGYWANTESSTCRYVAVDEDLRVRFEADLAHGPLAMGSVMFEDAGTLWVAGFDGKTGDSLLVGEYDTNLQNLGYLEVDVSPEGWTAYWSQAALRVGDTYVVAHMESDDRYEWGTLGGDLFVTAFDLDWNMIDTLRLSYNTPPNGGVQPGLAIKDDQLFVLYSLELQNYGYLVTLDLEAAGAEGDVDTDTDTDTDTDADSDTDTDTDTDADSDTDTDVDTDAGEDTGRGEPPDDCGCNTTTDASWALVGLGLLAVRRRR